MLSGIVRSAKLHDVAALGVQGTGRSRGVHFQACHLVHAHASVSHKFHSMGWLWPAGCRCTAYLAVLWVLRKLGGDATHVGHVRLGDGRA